MQPMILRELQATAYLGRQIGHCAALCKFWSSGAGGQVVVVVVVGNREPLESLR